jgi:uncharacterized membrane protein YvbJ
MDCPECGKYLEEDEEVCPACGYVLNSLDDPEDEIREVGEERFYEDGENDREDDFDLP